MAKLIKPEADPRSSEAYGSLCEGVHIAGYTFERACGKIEWLLEQDRWRGVGTGFDNVNAFLDSLRLESLRPPAEQRKRIAQRIKQLAAESDRTARSRRPWAYIMTPLTGTLAEIRHQPTKGPATPAQTRRPLAEIRHQNFSATVPLRAEAYRAQREHRGPRRRDERLAKIAEIAKGNTELGTAVRYPIIYADPPWRYENPPMGGGNRSIENHYPTMTLDELIALPVAQLATDDALLYLWATAPKLAECIDVLRAWVSVSHQCGVGQKKPLAWATETFRNQHELPAGGGSRGEIPPPLARRSNRRRSIASRREDHSRQTDLPYYEMIEREALSAAKPKDRTVPAWQAWTTSRGNAIPLRPGLGGVGATRSSPPLGVADMTMHDITRDLPASKKARQKVQRGGLQPWRTLLPRLTEMEIEDDIKIRK